jgi:O-antigen ligase/Tfp pilus assembly protein PilF
MITFCGFLMSLLFLSRYFGFSNQIGIYNQDHVSGYLAMIIPISIGFQFSENHESFFKSNKFLFLFSTIVMTIGLFFTLCRGGMICFMFSMIMVITLTIFRKKQRKKLWISILTFGSIILGIISLGATPILETILSIKAEITSVYFGGRMPIWEGTFNIIKNNVLFGTGLGTFNYIFPKYQPSSIRFKHYTYAHSDFLELLSEVGTIGFIIFLTFIFLFLFFLVKKYLNKTNSFSIFFSIVSFGSISAIFLHSFFDFNLHIPANAILLTIILGLLYNILNIRKKESQKSSIDKSIIEISFKKNAFFLFCTLVSCFIIYSNVWNFKLALGKYYSDKDGLSNLKKAIKYDPTNATYYYKLSTIHYKNALKDKVKKDELEKAYFYCKKAIALNPTNSRHLDKFAWISSFHDKFNQKFQFEEIAPIFEEAISFEPNNAYRYRNYGIWLFKHPNKNNINKAMEMYNKAILLKPSFVVEAIKHYLPYRKKRSFKSIVNIFPKSNLCDVYIFRMFFDNKNLSFLINFAKKFLRSYPTNAEIHFLIADRSFYLKEYNWDFTKIKYNKTFELAPYNGFYRMWYGIHLLYRKDYTNAQKNLQKALKLGLNKINSAKAKSFLEKCNIHMKKSI